MAEHPRRSRRLARAALLLAAALMVAAAGLAHASGIVQEGNLRVFFKGRISPRALPRTQDAPVEVSVASHITTTDGSEPPPLRTIRLAINRNGLIDYEGMPKCRYNRIQPTNNSEALEACRSSLVGTGHFSAKVLLPEQSPFPSSGRVLAFNGEVLDHPVIFAHIYGTKPVPTSFVLPFVVRHANGHYATTLAAYLPKVGVKWGFVTGLRLELQRSFRYRGKTHSYLSAACRAPKGFNRVPFAFAKAEFVFAGNRVLSPSLTSVCRVR